MKGILFKPDMIKVIVEGGKTVTRRVIKAQPSEFFPHIMMQKPRYQVGEVVYIKEAYMANKEYNHLKSSEIPKMGRAIELWYWADGNHYADKVNEGAGKVRSPLFMPEWAARYFIKITDVKAERLQEITEADALAEGCTIMVGMTAGGNMGLASAKYAYMKLWDSINKNQKWDTNPFVWRYSFIKVDHASL